MTLILSVLVLWGLVEVLSGGTLLLWSVVELVRQLLDDR